MYDVTRLNELLVNENGFAFDPATGCTYNLSLSGLQVIRWMKEGKHDEELLRQLMEAYEVDDRRAARDVENFLGSLARYGLVRPLPAGDVL